MTISDKRKKALIQEMNETVRRGQSIAILGWRDSNHNNMTRRLALGRKVTFYQDPPRDFGGNVGFIIATKFVGHGDFSRVKNFRKTHPSVITFKEIREMLNSCEELLLSPPPRKISDTDVISPWPIFKLVVKTEGVATVPTQPIHSVVASEATEGEVVVVIDPVKVSTRDFDGFVRAFIETSKKDKDGLVGKKVLGEIRRAHFIEESSSKLADAGWLIAKVSEGNTHAGRYMATEKLLGYFENTKTTEPTDPVLRAQWLVAQMPKLEEEIQLCANEWEEFRTLHEMKLAGLKSRLAKAQSAKELLSKLENL